MDDKPQKIDLTSEDVKSLLERIKPVVSNEDYETIKAMAETLEALSQIRDQNAASIKRLLNLLFGPKSEKKKKIFEKKHGDQGGKPEQGETPSPKGRKGHGRNGASAYTGAEKVYVKHESLTHGDPCPECLKGKVYRFKAPQTVVRIVGSPPLKATVYEMESLRCNLCGQIFTATPPENMGTQKYDETAAVTIALLKYANGFPFYRLEQFQASLGVPVPASTQWDLVHDLGLHAKPVYMALLEQAAQGQLFHTDDTSAKILSLMEEGETDNGRKGIFTTGILSKSQDQDAILYFTGRNHAGENLEELLQNRLQGLSPPLLMCDALSRNIPKELEIILSNCLTHGRRNFVDVIASFPDECQFVIDILAKVYLNDQIARETKMTPEARLTFHQKNSKPLMDELSLWLNKQLDQKLVEPNSGLGKAITYMVKHWEPLTRFLEVPGAPLDNNICERALKKAIIHRKNSLFYKTENGAMIGDIFMSLIQTCNMVGENPFQYLLAIHKNRSEVAANPENWLPWNFRQALPSANQ
jgi:transposase